MQRKFAPWLALVLALNAPTSQSLFAGVCPGATLMILDVTVTDQNGEAIQGLKRNDFSVTEDGKKQFIAAFTSQGPGLDSTPPLPGPNQFSGLNHRLITLLFDFTMMSSNERTRMQDDAIDFIRNDLKPGELLSIEAVTTGSVETIQDFTADQTVLVAAVNKLRTGIVDSSAPLAGIANLCRRLPTATKKSLFYFSAAFEQPGADHQAELDSAVNACKKANVAIYPIGAASASIAELATKTGGRIFRDRRQALDEVRSKSETYYVVGYYSSNGKLDGGYRNVEVKLTSSAFEQAKLDYSHGYFADLDLPKVTEANTPLCF